MEFWVFWGFFSIPHKIARAHLTHTRCKTKLLGYHVVPRSYPDVINFVDHAKIYSPIYFGPIDPAQNVLKVKNTKNTDFMCNPPPRLLPTYCSFPHHICTKMGLKTWLRGLWRPIILGYKAETWLYIMKVFRKQKWTRWTHSGHQNGQIMQIYWFSRQKAHISAILMTWMGPPRPLLLAKCFNDLI